jgi:hypothetical protein
MKMFQPQHNRLLIVLQSVGRLANSGWPECALGSARFSKNEEGGGTT